MVASMVTADVSMRRTTHRARDGNVYFSESLAEADRALPAQQD